MVLSDWLFFCFVGLFAAAPWERTEDLEGMSTPRLMLRLVGIGGLIVAYIGATATYWHLGLPNV